MQELINVSFQGANAIPSFLLIFVVLYWIVVLLGAIDLDFFDIDLDVDADGPDVDVDVDGPVSVGWFNSVLAFFNLGQIPLMIFLSFLTLPMWVISVQFNELMGNTSLLLGLVFLLPNLVISMFIAKFLTMPFLKIFAKAHYDGETTITMIGKICHVLLPLNNEKVGQVEVNVEGSNYRVTAKTSAGKTMQKGEEGLIIEYDENGKYYVVEPYEK